MHVRRVSESLWHQILFQMAITISSVYNHMYETLDMHVIHTWSYSKQYSIIWSPNAKAFPTYTQTHSYSNISEYGSTIHVQMACISCFLSAYNHALDQKRKTAAKHAYKARDV